MNYRSVVVYGHVRSILLAPVPNLISLLCIFLMIRYRCYSLQSIQQARLIPDSEHERKIAALTAVTNHPFRATSGDRWADARPPSEADVKSTRVVAVPIELASAKVRAGGPKDEKKDVENEDVIGKYWTGVVKRKEGWEAVEAGPYNRIAEPPRYIKNLVE